MKILANSLNKPYITSQGKILKNETFGDKISYDITPQNAKNFIETAQAQYPLDSNYSIIASELNSGDYTYIESGAFPIGYQTNKSGNIQLSYFDGNNVEKDNTNNYILENVSPNGGRFSVINGSGDTLDSNYIKPIGTVRFIETRLYTNGSYHDGMEATYNARDIGGWQCDGGTVKYGKIYRCANIRTSQDISGLAKSIYIDNLGVKYEFDLRSAGTPMADFPCANYIKFSGVAEYDTVNGTGDYDDVIKDELIKIFDAAKTAPLLIHCSMGCDRTGTLCFYIENILGMSETDIDIEYELSSLTNDHNAEHLYYVRDRLDTVSGTRWLNLKANFNTYSGDTLSEKVINYLLSIGITAAQLNEFRKVMCDGNPSIIITPTVNVSGTYTNCSTSNTSSTTNKYESYTATITADSGYTLEGAVVTITMGGNDITSTAYNNGVIYISEVSGDITISIEAQSSIINLFDPSNYVDGGRFNSSFGITIDEAAKGTRLVTDFIECSANNTITLDTNRSNNEPTGGVQNVYSGQILWYDNNKTYISGESATYQNPRWTWSADYKQGDITTSDDNNIRYCRICCAYSDGATTDNIKIYKN